MERAGYSKNIERAAKAVLSGAAVGASMVIACLAYYFLTGQRRFADAHEAVLSFGLPAAVTACSLAALRLKATHKVAAAAGVLVLGASAFFVELYLNAQADALFRADRPLLSIEGETQEVKQKVAEAAKQWGVDFDTRDKVQVIEELARQGIEAVPQIILPVFDGQTDGAPIRVAGAGVMPLSGISNKKTVVCNQNGDYLVYQTDEHGFHNPKGAWALPKVEIAVVGNSFTMGYCVSSDKNFVASMRARTPAMLNLGMPGEGPLQILAILKEYAAPLRPKRLLWFYFEGNSLAELQHEKRSPILMRYMDKEFSQGLLRWQGELDGALTQYVKVQQARQARRPRSAWREGFARMREVGKLTGIRKKIGLIGITKEEIETVSEANVELFRDILSQVSKRVAAWGGQPYFIYLPSWERYAKADVGVGARRREQVLREAKHSGFSVIDLVPAFDAHRDPLSLFPFRRFHHYNEKGHQFVADAVLKEISSAR